jgi:Holliday junction resolvase
MTNSRRKGKTGELEVVKLLRDYGFEARRGQQFKGTADSPDVIHNLNPFYIEVKRRQSVNLYTTLEKADIEKPDGHKSIVFHRKDGKQWLVSMGAEDFLQLMKDLYYGG